MYLSSVLESSYEKVIDSPLFLTCKGLGDAETNALRSGKLLAVLPLEIRTSTSFDAYILTFVEAKRRRQV